MARVTVEDCMEKVNNRFELVVYASQRARNIAHGEPITVPRDNDKNTVVALREIADETVSVEGLRDSLIHSQSYAAEIDQAIEDTKEEAAQEETLYGSQSIKAGDKSQGDKQLEEVENALKGLKADVEEE